MIRRELAKDPKLANESWDRFLPAFRKRHLKTSEKTAKKNERAAAKGEARAAAGLDPEKVEKEKSKKKVYTPFPPPQQPRKVDLQLESGEYFLKPKEREAKEAQKRKEKVSWGWVHEGGVMMADDHSSKQRWRRNGRRSARRSMSHRQRRRRRQWRRSGRGNGTQRKVRSWR